MDIAKKKDELASVAEVLECDGYAILVAEFKRKAQEGIEAACNVKLGQAERDAGAGTKATAEYFLEFLPAKRKSLESTLKKATSRK